LAGVLRPIAGLGRRARGRQGAAWKRRAGVTGGVPAVLDRRCARGRRRCAVGAEV